MFHLYTPWKRQNISSKSGKLVENGLIENKYSYLVSNLLT